MRKKALWGLVAAALIVTPAVIGLLVVGGDSGRNKAALVQEGADGTAYQLTLDNITPAGKAIDVRSFLWGAENPVTIGSATGGAGSGKVKFNEFTITKKIDEVSPKLFKALAMGTPSPNGVLKLFRAGEGKTPYATYTLKTVILTKVDHSGSADAVPDEQVAMIAGSMTLEMVPQDESGKLGAPEKAGWDQVMNRAVN